MQMIPEKELQKYGKTRTLSQQAIALVNQQKATWELAAAGYKALKTVRESSFDFGDSKVRYQFNPGRIRSSAADTSKEAILTRPCFLCSQNLPPLQAGIPYRDRFTILTNPFPIFPYHLTIPATTHIPQEITGNIGTLLDLSHDLPDFTLLYNGPQCGASAPDHLHFQAGIRDVLPVEEELDTLVRNLSEVLAEDAGTQVYASERYLRSVLIFRSANKESLVRRLEKTVSCLPGDGSGEPMMNIISWYQAPQWNVLLFPRATQRPWQYFAGDFSRLVISPAAVELGGLVILPREEDFYKLTQKDMISIYDQVCIQPADFRVLREKLKESFSKD
jgi:hypothetical protein